MISIERTTTFKKDFKRISRKHFDLEKMKNAINYFKKLVSFNREQLFSYIIIVIVLYEFEGKLQ